MLKKILKQYYLNKVENILLKEKDFFCSKTKFYNNIIVEILKEKRWNDLWWCLKNEEFCYFDYWEQNDKKIEINKSDKRFKKKLEELNIKELKALIDDLIYEINYHTWWDKWWL